MPAVFFAMDGLIIVALAWTLRRFGVPESRILFLSFLLFGLATGILAVVLWPMDTSVFPNVLAASAGDWIYVHAIEFIGDPRSDQAHDTIPWILRVPQVYALASCALSGALGMTMQWLYNHGSRGEIKHRNEPLGPAPNC